MKQLEKGVEEEISIFLKWKGFLYFGFVEVRENEGGHITDTSKPPLRAASCPHKDGCEPEDGPAPHEPVPQPGPAVNKM